MMNINIILLAIAVAILVFSIGLIIFSTTMQHSIVVGERIRTISGKQKKHRDKSRTRREKMIKSRLPISKVFADQLSTAGIKMRPEEFLTMWIIVSVLPAAIMIVLGVHIISIVAAVAIGVIIPPIWVTSKRKKQILVFDTQLGDALMLIGNCLRSGLTFQQAMGSIAQEMQDPIGKEFARAVKEIQLGTSLDNALANMLNRIDSEELMLTISAVQIQHQVGGNLMDILHNISTTISDRQKLKDDIKVLTATGRMSGMVIGLLPLGIGGILMLVNPEYIQAFFNTQAGSIMLGVSAGMEIIGYIFIRKTVQIKY